MFDRRQLLISAAAVAGASSLPLRANAAATVNDTVGAMNALFDRIMQHRLQRFPEEATSLGLDKGALAGSKRRLSEVSLKALEADRATTVGFLSELRAINRTALSGMDVVNYDTVAFTLATAAEGDRQFNYGAASSGEPYVISQLTGSYQQTPDFLDSQHVIADKADADAYIARLDQLAGVMDGELEIARHDAGLGVTPPDFAIDKALGMLKGLAATPAAQSVLVQSVAGRAHDKGIAGNYAAQATAIYEQKIQPAMARQITFLESVRPAASHEAGVWRLPKGDEYYAVSLKDATTTDMTGEEIHGQGLALVQEISAQIDAIFKANGLTQGSVGARLKALGARPDQLYADTDEAKVQLIADLNAKVEAIRPRLPPYFGQLPQAPVEIRRVPKAIQDGAPRGYYNSPTLDGSRPGIYWINLRNAAEVAKFTLTSLTYHEAIPGHHLQLALSGESDAIPLIRKAAGFSAYIEGWALYAEQLAVEMGMYADDPFGHVGQLQGSLFRAVRMVVDSGMHHKRWSREKAIAYFVETLGWPQTRGATEIERYAVWPGQACSYMVGKITWLKIREAQKRKQGGAFDIKTFHDTGLLAGSVPLAVLEQLYQSKGLI
ncbi:DUF885 domain-containing protein [Asticcacaulis endophyticus]|nr:DUF885 family protein [Asticcacaulis endophyticus]